VRHLARCILRVLLMRTVFRPIVHWHDGVCCGVSITQAYTSTSVICDCRLCLTHKSVVKNEKEGETGEDGCRWSG
jgi:hypothetical protein